VIDGKKIKKIRVEFNLSQSAVAERADISQTQLSKMELGQCDATTGVASAVARALGVELSEILIPENPTKPRPKKKKRQAGRKPGWLTRLMAL